MGAFGRQSTSNASANAEQLAHLRALTPRQRIALALALARRAKQLRKLADGPG